ncbi:hypothetical protein AAFF_G00042350 [Aldrovandia affinis]|uniref:Uncharacterized protein n=1 Tax=Aldrovandia affinis TaxID=143900 RepID=A0AAD7S2V4_9TELE|nr:hypothetical protein AAFF_G00042350 [Aldrovandia affinis]
MKETKSGYEFQRSSYRSGRPTRSRSAAWHVGGQISLLIKASPAGTPLDRWHIHAPSPSPLGHQRSNARGLEGRSLPPDRPSRLAARVAWAAVYSGSELMRDRSETELSNVTQALCDPPETRNQGSEDTRRETV